MNGFCIYKCQITHSTNDKILEWSEGVSCNIYRDIPGTSCRALQFSLSHVPAVLVAGRFWVHLITHSLAPANGTMTEPVKLQAQFWPPAKEVVHMQLPLTEADMLPGQVLAKIEIWLSSKRTPYMDLPALNLSSELIMWCTVPSEEITDICITVLEGYNPELCQFLVHY